MFLLPRTDCLCVAFIQKLRLKTVTIFEFSEDGAQSTDLINAMDQLPSESE
jgi:hypothetical protein